MIRLKFGALITSSVSGEHFKVAEQLGEGGFGCAYRVHRTNAKQGEVDQLCLKVTADSESWHRESYFGELLRKSDRAIHMYESFPLFASKKGQPVRYCLVSEIAEYGTVTDFLESARKAWTESAATKEIKAILKLMDCLHSTGAIHRDVTPMNVFVCRNRKLKLGDFGIATHVLGGMKATASIFNRFFVSAKMAEGEQRYWLAADDVFQMGQLLAMLLRGDPNSLIKVKDVKHLSCSERLQSIVARCIGPRNTRYENAFEMLKALNGDVDETLPKVEDLVGKTVVFTGPLSMKRFDAGVMVRQAGGSVADHVSPTVDVIVQGGRSALYSGVHKGDKLRAAEKLIREGHQIQIINESEFLAIVSP